METKLRFETTLSNNDCCFITNSFLGETPVCECKVLVDKTHTIWTISSWYTDKEYNHKGFGTETLMETLFQIDGMYGLPERVEYVWNGANEYVINWLNKNFGAVSKCPIAVQKYATDDDWESHIYVLNRDKFINYFNLNKPLYRDIDDIERED